MAACNPMKQADREPPSSSLPQGAVRMRNYLKSSSFTGSTDI
jgi:hypothetical protein